MNTDVILSGLGGAIIGSILSYCGAVFIYWHNGLNSARVRLVGELTLLRDRVYWNPEKIEPTDRWDSSLDKFWFLYLEYDRWLICRRRESVNKAWNKYQGAKEELLKQAPSIKRRPDDKNDFIQRIDDLLAAVRC